MVRTHAWCSRVRIAALVALAVAALAACGSLSEAPAGDGAPTTTDPGAPAPEPSEAARMLELVNEARAAGRSCGSAGWFAAADPLALEPRLNAAAQWYSDDMHANGAWGHVGSDGSTLRVRVDRTGYPWRALGENIAKGYTTPEHVMVAWLGSPGHCANIMRPQFTELGFGRAGVSWTQVFGRR